MGRKYRYKLLPKEVAQVNQILSDNNISFTFDGVEEYLTGLQQIAPILHKSYDRYLKFIGERDSDKFQSILKSSEYEVTDDMKLVSTGYGYEYKFHEYCPLKNVKECRNITNRIFNDVGLGDCVFGYNSEYGLIYAGDGGNKVYEGLYFWINQTIIDRTSLNEKRLFFEFLRVNQIHIDFMCSVDTELRFNYIGFNNKNLVVKYAVSFSREDFLSREARRYYSEYSKIDAVITCIENSIEKTNITMQFVPGKPDEIAVESQVSIANYNSEVEQLISRNIIDKSQGKKLLEMPLAKYHHVMFKYKWSVKDNLQVKVYFIEDLTTW